MQTLLDMAVRRPLTIEDLPQFSVMDVFEMLRERCPGDAGLEVLPGVNVVRRPHTVVCPDVAVVDARATGFGADPAEVALAVEVVTDTSRRRDLTIKRDLYGEWGIPPVLVDRAATPAVSVHGKLPDRVGEISL